MTWRAGGVRGGSEVGVARRALLVSWPQELNPVVRLMNRGAVVLAVLVGGLLISPAVEAKKPIVAVFDIEARGFRVRARTLRNLRDYLSARLAASGRFQVVPHGQLHKRMAAYKVKTKKSKCFDEQCQIELGKEVAAQKSLATKVLKLGGQCTVICSLYDLRRATSERSATTEGKCTTRGIMGSIRKVVKELAKMGSGQQGRRPNKRARHSEATPDDDNRKLPPVKAELGHLRVEGTPHGAGIAISGPTGFNGPNVASLPRTWQGIPSGRYLVKVHANEYERFEKAVMVLPDRTRVVTAVLEKAYGQLTIGGRPVGAKVELSGPKRYHKVFGLAESFTFRRIVRGKYTIRVTRTGYTSFHRTVSIQGGKRTAVAVKLEQVDIRPVGTSTKNRAGITWMYSADAGKHFSKSEVTLAQFRLCVQAKACEKPNPGGGCNWGQIGRDRHPVNCVNWHHAVAFCRWAGGRLPTEKEWHAEASHGGIRKYPWGKEQATCVRVVMDEGGNGCGRRRTWPVCSKPAGNSVSGLCDMSGNVWEWTLSKWPTTPARIVLGGGKNTDNPATMQSSSRRRSYPTFGFSDLGFRCVLRSVK